MNINNLKTALAAAVLGAGITAGMACAGDQGTGSGLHSSATPDAPFQGALRPRIGHEPDTDINHPGFAAAEKAGKPALGGEWFHFPATLGDDDTGHYRWGIRIPF